MLGQDELQKVRGNVRLCFAGKKVRLNLTSRARHTWTLAMDHTEYADAILKWVRLKTPGTHALMCFFKVS